MGPAVEDSLAALVDEVRTDRVDLLKLRLVPLLLLGQQHDRPVVPWSARGGIAAHVNGLDDIIPHVRGVVPVQVNDLLRVWSNVLIIDDLYLVLAKINWHRGRWRR